MLKIPAILLLVGFVFVFFDLPFMGVDLLIDAVGWLIVFNGVRVFRHLWPAFGPIRVCSLALVGLGALALFPLAGAEVFIQLAYLLVCVLFFGLAGMGFGGISAASDKTDKLPAGILAGLLLLLGLVVLGIFILQLTGLFSGHGTFGTLWSLLRRAEWLLHLLVLAGLVWYAFTTPPAETGRLG